MELYIIKIYFKSKKKPFLLYCSNKKHYDDMLKGIESNLPIIIMGDFSFATNDFSYSTIEKIK